MGYQYSRRLVSNSSLGITQHIPHHGVHIIDKDAKDQIYNCRAILKIFYRHQILLLRFIASMGEELKQNISWFNLFCVKYKNDSLDRIHSVEMFWKYQFISAFQQ